MKLTRDQILQEMGLGPVWKLRASVAENLSTSPEVADVPAEAEIGSDIAPDSYFQEAEWERVDSYEDFDHLPDDLGGARGVGDSEEGGSPPLELPSWPELISNIKDCRRCGLCNARQQAVSGVGDIGADWLFIGEGPGAEEDARDEPFVGQAGKLLDSMLAAIGLQRGDNVYIANAVKCRPPNNRTPSAEEIATCLPYLQQQIALIKPKLIVLLGRAAVNSILRDDASLASLRGKTLSYSDPLGGAEIPVVVTYHPAYLLRNLPDKAKAWEDLCRARSLMRGLSD